MFVFKDDLHFHPKGIIALYPRPDLSGALRRHGGSGNGGREKAPKPKKSALNFKILILHPEIQM
ncbi:hypothetical protein CO230_08915 [Chryseobacterium sp. 6424]|nr:hypothetical protein CO230_08915 [Chryseobacterium sp. 6424]